MNTSRFLFLAILLLASTLLSAQITNNPQSRINELTETSGFQFLQVDLPETPPVFSGDLFEVLDQAFDSLTALSEIKGFNAALLCPDGTLWKRATGISQELPDTVSLNTEDLMGIGSITKSYVAAIVLLLLEDGLLSLDDSIGMYLDPYPNVPGEATIRQLLSHRTGINDYLNENPAVWDAWLADPDSIWAVDTILYNHILEPNFEVGAEWSYSNTNYLLAGRIIENITGQPWHQVVRERIIDPMGLNHTFVYPYESPGGQNLSNCWYDFDGNGDVEDLQGNGITMDGFFSFASSAGCIISNPEDLAYFSQQLHGGSFLQPSTLAEMHTDYRNDPQGFQYGLGAGSVPVLGADNWGHGGSIIYRSLAYYFPDENMSFAFQQNDRRVGPDYLDIYDFYLVLLNIYLNYTPPTTSISDIDIIEGVDVFPNPTKDFVVIELDENLAQNGTLRIYNPIGQILYSETIRDGEHRKSIDLTNISEGTYFLSIGIGEKTGVKTLMIAH